MSAFELNIPLTEGAKAKLVDCFTDEKDTNELHKFIYTEIKKLCKFYDQCIDTVQLPCTSLDSEGVQQNKNVKLSDANLSDITIATNPQWVPDMYTGEKIEFIKLKLGKNSFQSLEGFTKIYDYRTVYFNDALKKFVDEFYKPIPNASEIQNTQRKKKSDETWENRKTTSPSCIEQAVFESISPPIFEKIASSADIMYDNEFDEIYKVESDKKE